jgi:hypothetical protein
MKLIMSTILLQTNITLKSADVIVLLIIFVIMVLAIKAIKSFFK